MQIEKVSSETVFEEIYKKGLTPQELFDMEANLLGFFETLLKIQRNDAEDRQNFKSQKTKN